MTKEQELKRLYAEVGWNWQNLLDDERIQSGVMTKEQVIEATYNRLKQKYPESPFFDEEEEELD